MREILNIIKYAGAINESVFYDGPLPIRYGKIDRIVILKNPSKNEVARLRAASRYGELRGLLDNDLLVWDAELATHSDIAAALSVDGSDLHLEPEEIKVNDLAPDCDDAEASKIAEWIKTNPRIIRIYGENVPLELESPDQVRIWNF